MTKEQIFLKLTSHKLWMANGKYLNGVNREAFKLLESPNWHKIIQECMDRKISQWLGSFLILLRSWRINTMDLGENSDQNFSLQQNKCSV